MATVKNKKKKKIIIAIIIVAIIAFVQLRLTRKREVEH